MPLKAKLLFALLITFIIALWWAQNHVWHPFDQRRVSVDGAPLAEDYVPVKSLSGDLFLRNQDHQPDYLIDVDERKVYLVGDYEALDVGTLITWRRPSPKDDPQMQDAINKNLQIGNEYIEFSDIWGRRWRVPK